MNRVSSIFSQMLKLVPAMLFDRAVSKHRGERHSRGFRSWDQFVAMLFCQVGQAKSLHEIAESLRASEGKLRHLGMTEAPARSTLAYANRHRHRSLRYWDESSKREFRFLTNQHELPAETVAAIYKQRWQVELFFKALKQKLRIKSFVGTSANALKTQIWTALIALLRQQLFVYRDLWLFLDHLFDGPPGANLAEEPPSPLRAELYEARKAPQPEPKSGPASAQESIAAGVPTMEVG